MEFTTSGIPQTLQFALQEYNLEQLNPDEHAFTIIERTLAYGNREELRWLFARYGRERLIAWIKEAGWSRLPNRRLNFWRLYFQLQNLPQRRGVWPH